MDGQQETAPPLTAQDVHDVVFDRAGFVDRGYDTTQVDAFLDRVAATIAELTGQVEALNEEVHRIRRWRQQVGAPVDATPPDQTQVYASAQRQVQVLTAHAHLVARHVVAQAQRRAAEIIQQARLAAGSVNGSQPDAGAQHDRADDVAQHDRPDEVEQPGQAAGHNHAQDPPIR